MGINLDVTSVPSSKQQYSRHTKSDFEEGNDKKYEPLTSKVTPTIISGTI